jgi:quercetin dioxygenase-like cupin family protein
MMWEWSRHLFLPVTSMAAETKGLPPAEAAAAADLVGYQPGAVVSRELLKKGTGTVTVFAFDQGQGLSEHSTPYDAIAHVIDGEAEITIDGRPRRVPAGAMILMPGGHPHALHAVSRFKMVLTMIRS